MSHTDDLDQAGDASFAPDSRPSVEGHVPDSRPTVEGHVPDSRPTVELEPIVEPVVESADGPQLTCSVCGAEVSPGDGFCESCGADLMVRRAAPPGTALGPCPDCGATAFTDGYCDNCGKLAPSPRDRIDRDLGTVAGVSDRGLRHSRNEDAMAFAVIGAETGRPAGVVVVCDGVSTSVDPQRASQLAAETALEKLLHGLRGGETANGATTAAIEAAQRAVTALAAGYPDRTAAPSCTIATAVVERGQVTVGWVGDSRVYWLADDAGASRRLTEDDTWAGQLIAGGAVEEAEAYKAPHAHAILRWLGPDAPDDPPHVYGFAPEGSGLVLTCSDGLWNYVWDAVDLNRIARTSPPGADPASPLAAGAVALTAVALEGGGQDNITTVLAAYPPDDFTHADDVTQILETAPPYETAQSDKGMGIEP